MVEKIFLINLERQPDRRLYGLGALFALGTPGHIIECVPAIDGDLYDKPNGREKMVNDMRKKGLEISKDTVEKFTKAKLSIHRQAETLTWALLFKRISVNPPNKCFIIMRDDYYFAQPWRETFALFKQLNECARAQGSQLRCVQLMTWPNPHVPKYDREFISHVGDGTQWRYGIFHTGAKGILLNSEGAQLMYELFCAKPHVIPERIVYQLGKNDDQQGFFAANEGFFFKSLPQDYADQIHSPRLK